MKDDIFWLVLKLEISYKSHNIWKDLGFHLQDFFEDFVSFRGFWHGEIFEFP